MLEKKIIDKQEFALCLGQNGGKITIGGYDESIQANSDEHVEWFALKQPLSHYKINLNRIQVGSVEIQNPPATGFVDSGTTFAYLSRTQKTNVDNAIMELCESGAYKCLGVRRRQFCWNFEVGKNGRSLKDYFQSYPVLYFINQEEGAIRWYPSEYFYAEEPGLYCLAIDPLS